MREVTYTDPEGRHWFVQLPDGVPDSEAYKGIPLGPPSLDELELPIAIAVRLHNELYHRRILTLRDAIRGQQDIGSAIRAALRVDVQRLATLYENRDTLSQGEGRDST